MRKFACITAVGIWEDHKCLFKNRDRNYKPNIRIYHELVNGTEVLYLKDEVTGWCEGMNEYGIGIINSALAVGLDEKEKELTKDDADGVTLRDGKRMLAALGKKDLEEALATIQTHDKGLRGHTIVANPDATYSLEATWEGHDYHARKLSQNCNHVRTNHGIYHNGAGYTPKDGDNYLSSLARRDQAQKALRGVDKIKDIAPAIYGKRKKDLADALNMVKLTDDMRTRSQAVMDLDALEMLLYILPGESKYLGYENKLPKGRDPKLSLQVFEYTPIKDGDFEVKSRKANADASRVAAHHSRQASDRAAVTKGEIPFYRGGSAPLRSGPAYFISSEMMAKFYGPVTEYRLRLRNPKFVDKNEWGRFDSIAIRVDPSPIEELYEEGYDSAVWAHNTPVGRMYTVFALNGKAVSRPAR